MLKDLKEQTDIISKEIGGFSRDIKTVEKKLMEMIKLNV